MKKLFLGALGLLGAASVLFADVAPYPHPTPDSTPVTPDVLPVPLPDLLLLAVLGLIVLAVVIGALVALYWIVRQRNEGSQKSGARHSARPRKAASKPPKGRK